MKEHFTLNETPSGIRLIFRKFIARYIDAFSCNGH